MSDTAQQPNNAPNGKGIPSEQVPNPAPESGQTPRNEYDWTGKVEKSLKDMDIRPIPGVTPGTCADMQGPNTLPDYSGKNRICAI